MKILNRLFGSADPLERIRRALREQRWADALDLGERLRSRQTSGVDTNELDALLADAGDGLARLNLFEGEACLRAGDEMRAAEHLGLAATQARSGDLVERIAELRRSFAETAVVEPQDPHPDSCGGGCGTEVPTGLSGSTTVEEGEGVEFEGRYELVLAGYPEILVPRYRDRSQVFREAFLLSHEGFAEEALARFDKVPEKERDDIFLFERGALLGRMGQGDSARRDLQQAIDQNPANSLCHETLVELELAAGETEGARKRLEKLLEQNLSTTFCHSRLAVTALHSGDRVRALDHALAAIEEGGSEPEHLVFTAALLEEEERFDEAEALLQRLSGGGCSGAPNALLAEFWLRRGKHPEKALEILKGAARREPNNPRWALGMGEACQALGWLKDARKLLEKAIADPRLEGELRRKAVDLLEQLSS